MDTAKYMNLEYYRSFLKKQLSSGIDLWHLKALDSLNDWNEARTATTAFRQPIPLGYVSQ